MNLDAELKAEPIIVAYDGSPAAKRALARAAMVAGERWSIVIVTVAEPDIRTAAGETIAEGSTSADAEAVLEEAASLLAGRGVDFWTRTERGDPAETLVSVARELDAALIVVGSRGDDFVTRALVGSVAAKLVEQAPCDVLVAR
jgi:nucleotide-binding universal stress UspA family protein